MDFELLKSIGSKIMGVAPALAGAVLAPNPVTVIAALAAIKQAVGMSPDTPEAALDAALRDNPEIRLRLVIAEHDYNLAMRKADNDELFTRLADIQSARQREVSIVQATGKHDALHFCLAVFGVLCPVALIFYLMAVGLPKMDQGTAVMVGGFIGVIIGEYKTIFGYAFGSSQSSKDKDATIAAGAAK